MTATDNDASNPIEAVRARLDGGRKWHKGSLRQNGNVCVMGAVKDAVGFVDIGEPETLACRTYLVLRDVVAEQYPDRSEFTPGFYEPAAFNDHPDTTWPEMDAMLDKASVRWDEQVDEVTATDPITDTARVIGRIVHPLDFPEPCSCTDPRGHRAECPSNPGDDYVKFARVGRQQVRP